MLEALVHQDYTAAYALLDTVEATARVPMNDKLAGSTMLHIAARKPAKLPSFDKNWWPRFLSMLVEKVSGAQGRGSPSEVVPITVLTLLPEFGGGRVARPT